VRKEARRPSRAGELQFFGNHTALTQSKAFSAFLAPLRNSKWVVYCKRPFGGRKQVFAFVPKGKGLRDKTARCFCGP
jgi:hypothetical protein